MKALTLKLDLATRLPSLRLPGNVKNYTCCHRGSSRHCFLCSCRPNVNLCWNTPQSKTQFQMYWNICKQAPASVRCHPAWFKSVKLKSKYSHTMHFAPVFDIREWSIFAHIFVCTSRSVCASRSGRYLHRGNHTQVPVCRKHFQFASQQTLDIVHIEISYWEVLQANCTGNEKLALSFLVLLFIVAWKNNQNMKRWRAAHKWTWARSLDEG